MHRRSTIGRLVALGILPVLLLTGAVPGWSLFFCGHMDATLVEPCCGDDVDHHGDAPEGLSLEADACCRKIGGEFARAAYVPLTVLAALPPLLHLELEAPVPSSRDVASADDARTPNDTGPPIRLRTQTFLI